jgi:putative ABC transport system substrate-binding protein
MIARRTLMTLLGGATVAFPVSRLSVARAQPGERMRRVGVINGYAEDDPETRSRIDAFRRSLKQLGWLEGRNLQLQYRWNVGPNDRGRAAAAELIALAPEVILASTLPVASVVKQATPTIPIVLAMGGDPIAAGLVTNLARPGGNVSGFSVTEPSLGGKWLELLRELAPRTRRIAVVHSPENPVRAQYMQAITAANARVGLEIVQVDTDAGPGIERRIEELASGPDGGLLVLPGASNTVHRKAILAAASKGRLPAIYPFRYFSAEGGLMSYGADPTDLFRRAAAYVDRILRGEKVGDLPMQFPTKFELVINLATAKALGLAVPPTLLARADEVIE